MGGGVGEAAAFGAAVATGAGVAIAGETTLTSVFLEGETPTAASTSTDVIRSNGPSPTIEPISTLCYFASFTKQIDQLILVERLQNLLNQLLIVIAIKGRRQSRFLRSILSRSRSLRNFQSRHTPGVREKIHGPRVGGININKPGIKLNWNKDKIILTTPKQRRRNNYGKVNAIHKSIWINMLFDLHLRATNGNQTKKKLKKMVWYRRKRKVQSKLTWESLMFCFCSRESRKSLHLFFSSHSPPSPLPPSPFPPSPYLPHFCHSPTPFIFSCNLPSPVPLLQHSFFVICS